MPGMFMMRSTLMSHVISVKCRTMYMDILNAQSINFFKPSGQNSLTVSVYLCCFKDSVHHWPASFHCSSESFFEPIKASHVKWYHTDN